TSLSHTPFLGALAGSALYALLVAVPATRRHLVTCVLTVMAIAFVLSERIAHAPFAEFLPGESTFDLSLAMRQIIIKKAWDMAGSAGAFGWGVETAVADLKSLDNAYLLIAIERGWIALSLWLAIFVATAAIVSRALRSQRSSKEARATLIAFCGTFGT